MIKSLVKHCWKVSGIYLIWTILHYSSSHLYTHFCTPLSISGFFTSPMLISTPHCYGFRWCINHGADALNSMWIVLGTWILSCLSWKNKEEKTN
jgi:hypothetical protein